MKTYKNIKDDRKTILYGKEKLRKSSTELSFHRIRDITIEETVVNELNKIINITAKNDEGVQITFKLFLKEEGD